MEKCRAVRLAGFNGEGEDRSGSGGGVEGEAGVGGRIGGSKELQEGCWSEYRKVEGKPN